MTAAMIAHCANNFKEDTVKSALEKVVVADLTIGEASLFTKLVTWTLLEKNLPELSLRCLSDIISNKKYTTISPILTLTV
jgi:hypothetical protein